MAFLFFFNKNMRNARPILPREEIGWIALFFFLWGTSDHPVKVLCKTATMRNHLRENFRISQTNLPVSIF